MFRVFNMGIGMVLAVEPAGLAEVLGLLRSHGPDGWFLIGTVQKGGSGVVYDLGASAGAGSRRSRDRDRTARRPPLRPRQQLPRPPRRDRARRGAGRDRPGGEQRRRRAGARPGARARPAGRGHPAPGRAAAERTRRRSSPRCARRASSGSAWPATCACSRRTSWPPSRGASSTSIPACCPPFPGSTPRRQALAHGVKVSAAPSTWSTRGSTAGPIVVQRTVPVLDGDTPDTLAARILEQEHRRLPRGPAPPAHRALAGRGPRLRRACLLSGDRRRGEWGLAGVTAGGATGWPSLMESAWSSTDRVRIPAAAGSRRR